MRAHHRHSGLVAAVLLVGALSAAACSNSNTGSTTLPPTTVPPTVENFTGTVAPSGSSSNNFTVRRSNGQLTVTLLSTTPSSTVVGIGVGNPTSSGCTLIPQASVSAAPGAGPHLEATAAGAGTYCLLVAHIGGVTSPIDYAVRVTHY